MSRGNEPAYPTKYKLSGMAALASGRDEMTAPGLTIRERFAMEAMQGFIAADADGTMEHETCSRLSVEAADALLVELDKK